MDLNKREWWFSLSLEGGQGSSFWNLKNLSRKSKALTPKGFIYASLWT